MKLKSSFGRGNCLQIDYPGQSKSRREDGRQKSTEQSPQLDAAE
jgi:hypothetical protein